MPTQSASSRTVQTLDGSAVEKASTEDCTALVLMWRSGSSGRYCAEVDAEPA